MTKHVMITGASSGIGAACALQLDRLGYAVLAGVRREIDGDALRRQASSRLTPVIVDVTQRRDVARAAEVAAEIATDTGLAGLVNNAGVAVGGPMEGIPLDALRRQLEVNVLGVVAMTQACLPLLRQGPGRVVNMGSISGRVALPLLGPYAASKFALEAITDCLRMELTSAGVFVSLIEPGTVATPIWDHSQAAADVIVGGLSEDQQTRYGPLIRAMRRAVDKARTRATPASRVARAVAHALGAWRPRTRYVIGMDAVLMSLLLRPLPDRLRDRVVLGALRRGIM